MSTSNKIMNNSKVYLKDLTNYLNISSYNSRCNLDIEQYNKITIDNVDYYIGKIDCNKNMVVTSYKMVIGKYDPYTGIVEILPDSWDCLLSEDEY
jgi:hypothetical protein